MHTAGRSVKDKRVLQGLQTRDALIDAALELFGGKGYAATSTDEIVTLAGVTKGALYHHFTDKETLFRAVFEQVQRQVSDAAVSEFLQPDPWRALVAGCQQWVEAHADPGVRQITLVDARGVLGWETARAIETRFSTVALRGSLRKAMQTGVLIRQPLRPLSLMLTGALTEACLYHAQADDPAAAHAELADLITGLLRGFRSDLAAVTPQETTPGSRSGDPLQRPPADRHAEPTHRLSSANRRPAIVPAPEADSVSG